jgi:hypothetical protein
MHGKIATKTQESFLGQTMAFQLRIIFSIGVWTQGLHFEPFQHPFFVMGFFSR